MQWSFPETHPSWAFPENLAIAALFKSAVRGLRYTGPTAAALSTRLHEIVQTGGTDQLGLLLRTFALLADSPHRDHRPLSTRGFSLPAVSAHQQAMAEAVSHLLANFREPIRLDELVQISAMSKPTFSCQCKRHSGKTFSDFVIHLRRQAARRELPESDRSILEIPFSCGFPQVSLFSRIFRRVLRCNPTEYRHRNRRA